jgi:YbbR domain-containing protein
MSFSIKNMFTRRIGLKLASVFLSLVVFVHVYTEQEREWTLKVPLETINLAEELCFVSPPPATVSVTVRGKGKDLIKLRFRRARAIVDLGGSKAGSVKRILSGSDILVPPDMNVTVADVIEPKVLSLELDPRLAKFIRVVPVYSGRLGSGLALSGPPQVEPEQIQATGARRVLAQLDYVNTTPIDIGGMTDQSIVAAGLDPGALNLSLDPSTVRVTFLVERTGVEPDRMEDGGDTSEGGG